MVVLKGLIYVFAFIVVVITVKQVMIDKRLSKRKRWYYMVKIKFMIVSKFLSEHIEQASCFHEFLNVGEHETGNNNYSKVRYLLRCRKCGKEENTQWWHIK